MIFLCICHNMKCLQNAMPRVVAQWNSSLLNKLSYVFDMLDVFDIGEIYSENKTNLSFACVTSKSEALSLSEKWDKCWNVSVTKSFTFPPSLPSTYSSQG